MSQSKDMYFESVTKTFDATVALENFSLTVRSGELLTLLGPSGCGKTTALRIAAGFERPDTGRVLVGAVDITNQPPHLRQMGMVFQSYSLFPHLSVIDNVTFGLRMKRVASQEQRMRGLRMLELVRMEGLTDRLPHQLSGGQQQRVALARALATQPDVLLLDEPLSALDAKVRAEVRDEIRTLTTRLGTTTVFVTHDQEEALGISDRICVMNKGIVEQVGSPTEIYDHPKSSFVADFVGELNRIRLGGVDLVVRPEQVILDNCHTADTGGEIVATSFHGSFMRYQVRLDDGQAVTAIAKHTPGSGMRAGTRVTVKIGDEKHERSV